MAKTITKTIQIKPIIRMRVRCQEGHNDPWLRRLYVVWAALPAAPAAGETATPPQFALAQSNDSGYLCLPKTDLDPDPNTTIAMFPDQKYYFYFVRWPDSSVGKKIVDSLNGGFDAGKKQWGEPATIAPDFKSAGKSKSGQPITEGIIQVAEDPAAFLPLGSSFYDNWVLFRDMPGTGANRVDTDIQCPKLQDQIKRLQYHLGRLRYPIGNQWHPYSPDPFTTSRGRGMPDRLYPNEGVFDILTWNAVLAFQRHARDGSAKELDPKLTRTPTLSDGAFDPLPAATDWRLELRESPAYVTTQDADSETAQADIPSDCDTVVELTTGDAIKQWLENNFRKPDKVMVAYTDSVFDCWMQEDALKTITDLDQELVEKWGVKGTIGFNSTFRDTRMSVVDPEPGQIITSIHKSGFAFDMAMDSFVGPRKDYPLYFVRDKPEQADAVWIVYTPVDKSKVPSDQTTPDMCVNPLPDYVEYTPSIVPWIFAPNSPNGGANGAPLQIANSVFLNFTKVCQHFGLARISAHSDWRGKDQIEAISLDSSEDFTKFVNKLGSLVSIAKGDKHPSRQTDLPPAVINGAKFEFSALDDASKYLGLWLKVARRHDATPEVSVDPVTKEGQALLRALRGKDFKGRKLQISVSGQWAGGEGAANVQSGATSTAELTLGPKTSFPVDSDFQIWPITDPVTVTSGSTIEFPYFNHPAKMEWWHFQYEAGFSGKKWGEILSLIGWTEEGLLGKGQGTPIFGHWGMGYLKAQHLDHDAR